MKSFRSIYNSREKGKSRYIERKDFMEEPPKKFFRLAPGREVRLKHAYIIKCEDVVKDEETGEIMELHCTYDPETRSGMAKSNRKVKGTLHWVSAAHAIPAEVRLYDYLFINDGEEDDEEAEMVLNPNSLECLTSCLVEPGLKEAKPGDKFQFLRQGYFCVDRDSTKEELVFNRIVSLRDTWARVKKRKQK
ncbi:MAG TPA: glutamine--tRNA ligase [Clostridia bacterium]|nr:glutamine--tRNA ligase [Clostridia bacterium]